MGDNNLINNQYEIYLLQLNFIVAIFVSLL